MLGKEALMRSGTLRHTICAYPLGAMLWRLTTGFWDSPEIRHELLRHYLDRTDEGASREVVDDWFKDKIEPCWMLLNNHSWYRMMAIGYQLYIFHQQNLAAGTDEAEEDGSDDQDILVVTLATWRDSHQPVNDRPLDRAVKRLLVALALAQLHFDVQFVGALVQRELYHDCPTSWEFRSREAFHKDWTTVENLLVSLGRSALDRAQRGFHEFLMGLTDNDAYERALRFWCGPLRIRQIAGGLMHVRDEEALEALFDADRPVTGEQPPAPPVPRPEDPDGWEQRGGILIPKRW